MGRRAHVWWWEARKAYYVKIGGKRLKLSEDKKEADKLFHKMMANPEQPPEAADVSVPFAVEIMDQFFAWVKDHRAKGTAEWYRLVLEPFAKTIKHLTIDELKPCHVEDWVQKQDWKPATRRGAITAIKRCFRWAEKSGRIKESPVLHVERPEAGKREAVITLKQYKELLPYVRDRQFRRVLRFAWETGARPQEIVALEARHYDKANSRMVMPKEEAKGKKRPRVIYLSDRARSIIEQNLGERKIFKNTDGRPFTKDAVNCRFTRLKDKIGTKHCLYEWRHSFATRKLQEGVDPLTVALMLGHANPSILASTYQHLALDPQNFLKKLKKPAIKV